MITIDLPIPEPEPAPVTIRLALVETHDGTTASTIIALLTLCAIECQGDERVFSLSARNRAMPFDFAAEISTMACYGLDEPLRRFRYLMPLAMAQRRVAEQPDRLSLIADAHEATLHDPTNLMARRFGIA